MALTDKHLEGASALTKGAIRRLAALPQAPLLPREIPIKAQAAVAVFLFQAPSAAEATYELPFATTQASSSSEYEPELHVICTTRAAHLRSHPGQASLPGGRIDATDDSVADTAFRETCEEIYLSPDALQKEEAVYLGTLEPFLSKTALIVHPVVFWIPVQSCDKTLASLAPSPDEVAAIWTYPLRSVLSSQAPRQVKSLEPTGKVELGPPLMRLKEADQVDLHRPPQDAFRTYSEVPWLQDRPYRLHRFRSSHQLIKGLTADVLIHVASLAYAQTPFAGPLYNVHAAKQAGWNESVAYIVQRTLAKAPREKSRWGDGESGDSYGTVDRYTTHLGHDEPYDNLDAEARLERDRDIRLTLRQPERRHENGVVTEEQQAEA